jgi:hypothetical protein
LPSKPVRDNFFFTSNFQNVAEPISTRNSQSPLEILLLKQYTYRIPSLTIDTPGAKASQEQFAPNN